MLALNTVSVPQTVPLKNREKTEVKPEVSTEKNGVRATAAFPLLSNIRTPSRLKFLKGVSGKKDRLADER